MSDPTAPDGPTRPDTTQPGTKPPDSSRTSAPHGGTPRDPLRSSSTSHVWLALGTFAVLLVAVGLYTAGTSIAGLLR